MAAGFAALTVGVVVSLCLQIYGESLSQPGKVRFVADIINHVLHWTPGVNHSSDTLYEVEYKLYGKSGPWMAVPDCTGISGHSCDLTYQTMDPSQRYYARVRAVSGNHTSGWSRTNAFSLKEATLHLSDVSLSVTGNTIHVSLQQLILRVGNKTVSYKDIQKYGRQYRTYVRRASDNLQQVQVETREEFDIPMLLWGEQYCVRVEPRVLSRPVPSIGTEEKCVTIPEKDESTGIISVSVGIVLLVFSATLLLGTLLLCAYVKQPMRTPAILKSLLKPSGSEHEHEHFPFGARDVVVCLDEESIQQLSVCQRDTVQHHSTDSGSSPAQQPPDKGCTFLTSPDDHEHLLELEGLAGGDSSCTSTDSGICLQDSSSGLSQFSGSESQDYQRQLPGSDDSGISLARHSLCLTLSSSGRDYTSVDEGQDQRERERDCSPLARRLSQEAVEFRGYLKQPKGTVERQQDRAEGQLPTQSPGGTDNTLEMGCSEPALAKGYLKQASPGLAYDNADTVLARESGSQGFTSRLECNSSSLLNYGALGISVPSKSLPEFPKAPFALGIFNTDLLGSLPLISSLHSNERLCLEIDCLSLLGSECKDSRL